MLDRPRGTNGLRGWVTSDLAANFRRFGRDALNLIFSPECAYCGCELEEPGEILLCAKCRSALAPEGGHRCRRCGSLVPSVLPPDERCPRCRKLSLKFDAVLPLGAYEGELRAAVLRLKANREPALTAAVAALVWEKSGKLLGLEPDVIVPVPMHWRRRLVRGASSAELLAENLGRRLRVPVARRMIVRRRNTPPQAGLSPRARFRNVRGAFVAGAGYYLEAARVLLIDDILTTGATCSEAASTLRDAGASTVWAIVVARSEAIA